MIQSRERERRVQKNNVIIKTNSKISNPFVSPLVEYTFVLAPTYSGTVNVVIYFECKINRHHIGTVYYSIYTRLVLDLV